MPQNERHARGQRAAGLHLRRLILQPGPYRDAWEQHAHDVRPDEIRQDAVCTVIAEHLYETGAHDETDTGLARTLKDRVSRAFSGWGLSLQTLRWFDAAFRLSPHDAQWVHELYRGDLRPTVIAGQLPPPAGGGMTSGHEITGGPTRPSWNARQLRWTRNSRRTGTWKRSSIRSSGTTGSGEWPAARAVLVPAGAEPPGCVNRAGRESLCLLDASNQIGQAGT